MAYSYEAPVSQSLFDRASVVTPGGVNSPVRAFRAVGGTPRFMVSGTGPYLTDADGREYVDLVCSWGPMILGHSHPEVIAAVQEAVSRGTSFGTPGEGEVALAEEIVARIEPVEQVRLVSSGTEATMSCPAAADGMGDYLPLASRSAARTPTTLKETTTRAMATPGTRAGSSAPWTTAACPSCTISPQSELGGWAPKPR